MYRLIPIEAGKSISVPVLYPEELKLTDLNIQVRQAYEQIDIGGVMNTAFVCDVGSPTQVHYVSEQGQLLQVEWLDEEVTIKLDRSGLS
jgi:hypothetical protein